MLLVDVVEVTAGNGGGQPLGHVLQAALRERNDLVIVRLALDRPRQKLHRRAAIDGQHLD